MKFTIEANRFRALMTTAAKNDVRYYLNGIHLNIKQMRVEATDGHRAIYMPLDPDECTQAGISGDESIILSRPAKLPNKTDGPVQIEITGTNNATVTYTTAKGAVTIHQEHIIDGQFPDLDRVMPDSGATAMAALHFNPLLVADMCTILGTKDVRITHHTHGIGAYLAEFLEYPEIKFCFMGLRD